MEHCDIQFRTIYKDRRQIENPLVDELMAWCIQLDRTGFAPECAGNLSVRTKQGFIITTFKSDFSSMSKDDFSEVLSVDMQKKQAYANGSKDPSSETFLHHAIYSARKDANAVFHAHCDAFLEQNDKLNLPITAEEKPAGSLELVDEVLKILDGNNFILLKNHGFAAIGDSIGSAGNLVMKRYNQLERIKRSIS